MTLRGPDMMMEMMPPGSNLPLKGATLTARNRTLQQWIATAYKMKVSDVSGPGWISDLRFDIEAKLPEGAGKDKVNEMLQALLEERFGLKTHRESRVVSGAVLTVAKDGPHLTPAAEQPKSDTPPSPEEMKARMAKMQEETMKRMQERQRQGMPMGGSSSWRSGNATIASAAGWISTQIHAPVIDQTGLDGKYEMSIEVLPPDSPDEAMEYRISKAISKYGLKLETKKVPVDVLVVDAASKTPTEN